MLIVLRLVLILLTLTNGNISSEDTHLGIINGKPCEASTFPFALQIRRNYDMISHCGGSLLNARNVLTAAHCYRSETLFFVIAGQSNLGEEDEDIQIAMVDRVIVHPYFENHSMNNDLAIFKLATDILETPSTRYVKLPPTAAPPCKEAATAGWGVMDSEKYLHPLQLQCTNLKILDRKQCRGYYSEIFKDICTTPLDFQNYTGVCYGDSGGPLMCNDTQYGIVSWGSNCNNTEAPQVFVEVSAYNGFIFNYAFEYEEWRDFRSTTAAIGENVWRTVIFSVIMIFITV